MPEDIRLDGHFDVVVDGTGDADTVVDEGYLRQRVAIRVQEAINEASAGRSIDQAVKRNLDTDEKLPSPARVSVEQTRATSAATQSTALRVELPNAQIKIPIQQ